MKSGGSIWFSRGVAIDGSISSDEPMLKFFVQEARMRPDNRLGFAFSALR
jgi:hypothetical protein